MFFVSCAQAKLADDLNLSDSDSDSDSEYSNAMIKSNCNSYFADLERELTESSESRSTFRNLSGSLREGDMAFAGNASHVTVITSTPRPAPMVIASGKRRGTDWSTEPEAIHKKPRRSEVTPIESTTVKANLEKKRRRVIEKELNAAEVLRKKKEADTVRKAAMEKKEKEVEMKKAAAKLKKAQEKEELAAKQKQEALENFQHKQAEAKKKRRRGETGGFKEEERGRGKTD